MENEEKGILVEQVVQADRIRTHGKFHERLFLLLRIIYFLIGMLGVVLGLALTYEIELNYVLLVVGTIVIGLLITAAWEDVYKRQEYRRLFNDICNALSEYSPEWKEIVDLMFRPKCEVFGYCPEEKSCGRMPKKEK